jgi:hypothetical protein
MKGKTMTSDLTEAPERILCIEDRKFRWPHGYTSAWPMDPKDDRSPVEYIRADLARPKVKPLVWKWLTGENTGFLCSGDSGALSYSIMVSRNRVYGIPGPFDSSAEYETLEDAKAAAQADYERRILGALE